MLKYICKRLLLMIPTLLGIIFIVFTVMNLTPGSPGRTILGTAATQEQVDQLNHELGYDRPFLVRFFDYCGDLLQGDMGTSYRTRADFTTELKGRMPTTLKLGIASFVLSSIPGLCYLFTGQKFSAACRESNLFSLFRARKKGRSAARGPH